MTDPTKALQRFWNLSGSGVTADLTFTYLQADVPGTANACAWVVPQLTRPSADPSAWSAVRVRSTAGYVAGLLRQRFDLRHVFERLQLVAITAPA